MNPSHLQSMTDEEIINHYEHDENMVVRDLCRRLAELCDEHNMYIEDSATADSQLDIELNFGGEDERR